jgi:hypothetical protein
LKSVYLELKRKLADVLERVTDLQNELFPNKATGQTNFLNFI